MSSEKKTKDYPRALPYRVAEKMECPPDRLPPDTAEPPARPRNHKALWVGIACILVLAGVGFALMSRHERLPSDVDISAVPQPDLPSPPVGDSLSSASLKFSVEPAVIKKSAAENVAVSNNKERYLEALGSLAAVHLYQSFLNIGLLADAVENDQMESADAEKTLLTITRMVTLVENQLDEVAKTGLDANDQKAMQNIRRLTGVLQTQATSLRAYWTTADPEEAVMYHKARTQAWAGISEMLGIENADTEMLPEEKKGTASADAGSQGVPRINP